MLIAYWSFLFALISLEIFQSKESFILLMEQPNTLKIQFWLLMPCVNGRRKT